MATQSNLVTYEQTVGAARRVIASLKSTSEQLERGQADMPMAEYFRSLERELTDETWVLCVVAAPEAFEPLVAWLCNGDHTNVRALESRPGVVELCFHGERFVLERASTGPEIFDSIPALLQALVPAVEQTFAEPAMRVSAPASGRAAGVRIEIVVDAEQLAREPRLTASLIGRSNALWIAGPQEWRWDESTREALRSLCVGMDFVCAIVFGSQVRNGGAAAWWTDATIGLPRPRVLQLNGADTPIPGVVTEERNPLRRALRLARLQRRLAQGLDTVKERLEFLRQQQRARRQKEERSERALGDGAADTLVRGPIDGVRTSLAEELSVLQRGLQETSRRALARDGELAQAVNELVQSVSPADLVQTPAGHAITLSLDEGFTDRFARELRKAFKEQLRRDLVTLRDGLHVAAEGAQRRLTESLGVSMPLDLQPPDERPIREVLSDVVQLQLKYRGELPRRSFLQRLGEGRRMLFTVLMGVSLFGGLLSGGKNVRTLLAPFGLVFVVLFLAGVLWTYRTWGRDDQRRIAKEVEKIREQLHVEAMRLVRDGERERLARLIEALETVRKEALRRVDEVGRQLAQQAAGNQARERNAVRDRLRIIDQRIKELDSWRSTVQRAEQDGTEFARQAQSLLGQAMRESHAAA